MKPHGDDNGRIVVNRFLLSIQKLTPKDSMYDKFVSSFLKETQWTYIRELYEVSELTQASGFLHLLVSIMSNVFSFT